MIRYRCTKDNIETKISRCPVCKERTMLEASDIYWCEACNIPLYEDTCSLCGSRGKRVASDIRPVFPEERLLLELILEKPFAFIQQSIWNASGNFYIVDGKRIRFSVKELSAIDAKRIRKLYDENIGKNSYLYFEQMIERFIKANQKRFDEICTEATDYIREETQNCDTTGMFVSFSGGKDSTVTSELVMRALSNSKILHIFGDTTLEFPETMEYVSRFKRAHPKTPMVSSRNKEKDFQELCQQIGPPSRVMRWCCTVFKTGAITKKIATMFRKQNRILTFYGIRRSESTSRSKYERSSESPKIAKQITISPIIDWLDFDVWLYLLTTKIDFNNAYRLGYTRVGCWCCPNNSGWSEFLSNVHMPEQYEKWQALLVDFARQIGKLDAEDYVKDGKWKARQGGNGVAYANKSVISFKPCATSENSFNYDLQRPIAEELYELFKPFGYINRDLGNARLNEVYILNKQNEVQLKLQGRIGTNLLKVTIVNPNLARAKGIKTAEEKVKCQITKYQMCMGCKACESVCKYDAIQIKTIDKNSVSYKILEDQCVRCGSCIAHFNAGCYMRKVLAIKRN